VEAVTLHEMPGLLKAFLEAMTDAVQ
jgi:hypothetical protein